MIQLLNIDCMAYMATCRDKEFDLAVVDPPYGINAPNMQMGHAPNRKEEGQYPGKTTAVKLKANRLQRLNGGGGKLKNRILNKSKIEWDNEKPSMEYFNELFRISKNQIIWGGNYFPLPPTRGIAVWNKKQPWENFSQCELAWTSFDCPAKLLSLSNTGGGQFRNQDSSHTKACKTLCLVAEAFRQVGKQDCRHSLRKRLFSHCCSLRWLRLRGLRNRLRLFSSCSEAIQRANHSTKNVRIV